MNLKKYIRAFKGEGVELGTPLNTTMPTINGPESIFLNIK